MEFNKELYQRTFSGVKASPEKMQEVIRMTENRGKRPIVRRMLAAAIVAALAVLTVVGANAASGGALFARIVSYTEYAQGDTQVGTMTIEVEDGTVGPDNRGEITFHLEEDEDGTATFRYQDENGRMVEQKLDLEQGLSDLSPEFQLEDKNGRLAPVQVTGIQAAEDHETITVTYTEGGEEHSAVLLLPEDCRSFEDLSLLLADGGSVCGKTQAGQAYQISLS